MKLSSINKTYLRVKIILMLKAKIKSKGFTLIEVLIAVAIMATLGLLTAQTIRQAIRQKNTIQEQVNQTSRLRDAMKIFERDINLAYHHRDWEKEITDLAKKKTAASAKKGTTPGAPGAPGTPGVPGAPGVAGVPGVENEVPQFDATGQATTEKPQLNPDGTPVEAPRKDPSTSFIGKENEISFVTMNTGRLLKDLPQADFIEVGYKLKDCRSLDNKIDSKCLFRRTFAWVDTDVTKGGDEILLLENITEFSLRYLGKGKQDWVKDWRSDSGGDGATKGNFPWAVEVSITTQKKDKNTKGEPKKYSMQLVIPIHFPNNKDDYGS